MVMLRCAFLLLLSIGVEWGQTLNATSIPRGPRDKGRLGLVERDVASTTASEPTPPKSRDPIQPTTQPSPDISLLGTTTTTRLQDDTTIAVSQSPVPSTVQSAKKIAKDVLVQFILPPRVTPTDLPTTLSPNFTNANDSEPTTTPAEDHTDVSDAVSITVISQGTLSNQSGEVLEANTTQKPTTQEIRMEEAAVNDTKPETTSENIVQVTQENVVSRVTAVQGNTATNVTTEPNTSKAPEEDAPVADSPVKITGIIRILRGMDWMWELEDRSSPEFQYYSGLLQTTLESVFKATAIGSHLSSIIVDNFWRGSVFVRFRMELSRAEGGLQPDYILRLFETGLSRNYLGPFLLDPEFTRFEVGSGRTDYEGTRDPPIPQWAIAVIVIAAASFIFIVLFGTVTVSQVYTRPREMEEDQVLAGKDWESKMAYDNFGAGDSTIYDLDDLVKEEEDYKDSLGIHIPSQKWERI